MWVVTVSVLWQWVNKRSTLQGEVSLTIAVFRPEMRKISFSHGPTQKFERKFDHVTGKVMEKSPEQQ